MKKGKGVLDFTNYLSGNRPQFLSLIMQKMGDLKIEKIDVYRKPVNSMLQKIFNWSNSGQWEAEKKRLNYDDIYHLSMIVKLSNGMEVMMEKSAKVNIKVMPKSYSLPGERITINKINSTFSGMIINFESLMRKKGLSPYIYNAKTNNCQIFILNLIRGAGISDSAAETFIRQDTDTLLGDRLEKIAKPTTDIAGAVSSLLGTGKKRMKSEIHAIVFSNQMWDATNARAWLKKHNLKAYKKVHKTNDTLRYSMTLPEYERYSTKKNDENGLSLVLGWR